MILVIGRNGQLARALVRRAAARGVAIEVLGRPEIDLMAPDSAAREISARKPSVVLNAAAYTAVDKAEDDAETAQQINANAPEAMARAAADVGAAFVQVSTDYVFAGDKDGAYVETDAVAPNGVYGATKLEGEQRSLAANARTIVMRTAWVYDASGANFVRTMLRLSSTRDELGVVADQRGCPTFADDLADAALSVALKPQRFGVYHCAGAGETTWADFAEEIFAQSRALGGPRAAVRKITTAEFPTRAKRPANSRLDCTKLARDYGVVMRPWREALSACMDEIAAGGWRVQ
ncbi:dTDP-4-dehydrorhamnose reductase [Terricaulis sp.]|uniref:dTDP-4-dehydrorhamnose reductase n=1 Tax=Terricaulis sp. TaxID=2768686 RepID=UPI002AC5704C|nr:dTDP-4-dehydrorhamnose reductase [Terricaulis sp.]MDZ4690980.1 dTDP-4-dehydrorhamnose reductase [Terricaulis sp.]